MYNRDDERIVKLETKIQNRIEILQAKEGQRQILAANEMIQLQSKLQADGVTTEQAVDIMQNWITKHDHHLPNFD